MNSPLIISCAGIPSLFYVYGLLGFMWLAVWDPSVPHIAPRDSAAARAAAEDAETYAVEGGNGTAEGGGAGEGVALLSGVGEPIDRDGGGDEQDGAAKAVGSRGSMSISPGLPGASSSSGGGGKAAGDLSLIGTVPWRAFLSNRCFYTLLWAHTTFGIGYSFFIAWLPTYYAQAHGINLKQSSWLSILPFAAMAIGTNASGWLADALINARVMSPTRTRKLLQICGNLGPAICLLYLARGNAVLNNSGSGKGSLVKAVALLTVSMLTLGLQAGGFASTHTDIATRYASALFGITNAGASCGGMLFVYLVGVILDTSGSWSLVFQLVAVVNFASAALFMAFGTSEPQFE
ncbi:hypothetical protein FOA52_002265 [Chlamydomonas sp. UWO 241]|nr:hypothetical protein FOA52_002265 [Chlamydomonas sp. UWO 241]